jgi:hypothetical protein
MVGTITNCCDEVKVLPMYQLRRLYNVAPRKVRLLITAKVPRQVIQRPLQRVASLGLFPDGVRDMIMIQRPP